MGKKAPQQPGKKSRCMFCGTVCVCLCFFVADRSMWVAHRCVTAYANSLKLPFFSPFQMLQQTKLVSACAYTRARGLEVFYDDDDGDEEGCDLALVVRMDNTTGGGARDDVRCG